MKPCLRIPKPVRPLPKVARPIATVHNRNPSEIEPKTSRSTKLSIPKELIFPSTHTLEEYNVAFITTLLYRLTNLKDVDSEQNALFILSTVEKEMQKASRNLNANDRLSPKIVRPGNPLGKLFESDLEEFMLCPAKPCSRTETFGSFSTEGSLKE